MNKTLKIASILLITILLVSVTTLVSASYITPGQLTGTPPTTTEIQSLGNRIIGILTTIGIIVSVVVLLVLGIKYMMGSAEEKAEYKKTMIPYLIGAVLIFGASTIASAVVNFF